MDQIDRIKRIESVEKYSILDNSMESLLRQAKEIAGMIRFYNLNNEPDGYFDEIYDELQSIHSQLSTHNTPLSIEPSTALLQTFIKQLHLITQSFNEKWHHLAEWYINDILNIREQIKPVEDTLITFTKNVPGNILIKKGMLFTSDQVDYENRIYYQTTEDLVVSDISIEKAFSLYFEKHPDISPANKLKAPTSIRMKDLKENTDVKKKLFEISESQKEIQPLGLQITSPALLLKEGKRFITIIFTPEKEHWVSFSFKRHFILLGSLITHSHRIKPSKENIRNNLMKKILSNIFYLEMSTAEGWQPIKKYTIDFTSELILAFSLPVNFPETTSCKKEMHQFESAFPSLRINLNRDAWLFPYFWLRQFIIMKIRIKTQVQENGNILFYNELGKVDNSIPFAPFGINTEKGAWFAIGNYEMAVKNTKSIDINIQWQQLPDDDGGLYDYYSEYKNDKIDNCSFRLRPRYLKDYNWFDTKNSESFFLFNTVIKDKQNQPEPKSKLSSSTLLKNILLEEIKPTNSSEDAYEYNMQSKEGFVSFVMERPSIGFGEKRYRQLFSEAMVKKSFRKKNVPMPNPPITPLIERITFSYQAEDEIDLRVCNKSNDTGIFYIHPLGIAKVYPDKKNAPIPFIYSMQEDANILLALKNVTGDEFLQIHFDFCSQSQDFSHSSYPVVSWYWGNGFQWRKIPDEYQLKDSTQNFSVSGTIKFYIPEIEGSGLKDDDDLLWLCAGISQNEENIAFINSLYSNVVKVQKVSDQINKERPLNFKINMSEIKIPGIAEVMQITPFLDNRATETSRDKIIRVSEYISHKGKPITCRDYERIVLQEFPEVKKVICLPNYLADYVTGNSFPCFGMVTLVIIPVNPMNEDPACPFASSELLIRIRNFLNSRISGYVRELHVINPVYEEIWVRCDIESEYTSITQARIRAIISRIIKKMIAPWMLKSDPPKFEHTFTISELHDRINKIKQVKKIRNITVVHLIRKENKLYKIREYKEPDVIITASKAHAVLIPAPEHLIITGLNDSFGIEEMKINENFVIWQDEIEIH